MANANTRYRKQAIKQKMKEQKASKITSSLKDYFVNLTEEQSLELAESIHAILNEPTLEEQEKQQQEQQEEAVEVSDNE